MYQDLREKPRRRNRCPIFFEHSHCGVVQHHHAKSGVDLDETAGRLNDSRDPPMGDPDACDEEASFEPE
eukprot:827073-Pyramimonas_sp.AAC.1